MSGPQGETVAMGDHMPVHLGAMPASVEEALRSTRLEPGDLVILNDPFRGGTHLPDITAVSGVFLEGEATPAYYAASRAHHSDVGGMSPGSMPLAREIYQEGLRIPPVKLIREGRMTPAGLAAYEARKPERTGIYAYERRHEAQFEPEQEERFQADPPRYLNKQPAAAPPALAAPGGAYTCPMHPEVREDHPAACPLCGMGLEPVGGL